MTKGLKCKKKILPDTSISLPRFVTPSVCYTLLRQRTEETSSPKPETAPVSFIFSVVLSLFTLSSGILNSRALDVEVGDEPHICRFTQGLRPSPSAMSSRRTLTVAA